MFSMLSYIKNWFLHDENRQKLNYLKKFLVQINDLAKPFSQMTKAELLLEHKKNKDRKGDDLVIYGFALIREVSKREIGLYHYDEQILGALVLNQGNIAEMKTGEGKTLISPPVAYISYIKNSQTHIVTANDYLAERDCKWLKPIYDFLEISSAFVLSEMSYIDKLMAYSKNIVYVTSSTLGLDYLKDNLRQLNMPRMIKNFTFAIIDEIDYILIDEARVPLIISGPKKTNIEQYSSIYQYMKKNITSEDYVLEKKTENIMLSESGIEKFEKFFEGKIENSLFDVENIYLLNAVNQSLRAHFILQKDKDYIVSQNRQIIIIDQMSGRALEGRSFSNGLQQFLQIKENLNVEEESQTLASITFANLFRSYEKLSGMTGTASHNKVEFKDIFNLDVTKIPTHKPMIRKDLEDRVYGTTVDKYRDIIADVIKIYETKRPILIGTISIEQSEYLSSEFKKHKIPHQLLNAKNPYQESKIIADAGKLSSVTIATNMAGRGTDILLGGKDESQKEEVIKLGGLFVIGVERNESKRIDDQLIGRSGRQGDPGTSVFYLSCEDALMRRFHSIAKYLKGSEKTEWSYLTKQILSIQNENERMNYKSRKYLIEFDDIINYQRKIIYKERESIFNIQSFKNSYVKFIENWLDGLKSRFELHELTLDDMITLIEKNLKTSLPKTILDFASLQKIVIDKKTQYINHIEGMYFELVNKDIKSFVIRTIDLMWIQHINNLEYLQKGADLKSYAQKDPMIEYKREAFILFEKTLDQITEKIIIHISSLYEVEEDVGVAGLEPTKLAQ